MLKSLSQLPEDFKDLLSPIGELLGFIGFVDELFLRDICSFYGNGYCIFDSVFNGKSDDSMEAIAEVCYYMARNDGIDYYSYGDIDLRVGFGFIDRTLNLEKEGVEYRVLTKKQYMEELQLKQH